MQTRNYDVAITPSKLTGGVIAPPSKSMSHRAVICAGLSEKPSILDNIALSDDIIATIEAMRQLGAEIEFLSLEDHGAVDEGTRHRLRIANPSMQSLKHHLYKTKVLRETVIEDRKSVV